MRFLILMFIALEVGVPPNPFTDDVSHLEKLWILLSKYLSKGSGHQHVSLLKM